MIAHRFTVDQYHRMIETGVLAKNDRVELLEGCIVPKMTHNPPHDCAVSLIQSSFYPCLPKNWILRIQSAITVNESEPEPDVVVSKGPARRYITAHPSPRDIGLLVEVSESSLEQDREEKGRIYARARIPIYWIVNRIDSIVEVYTKPSGRKSPAYLEREDYCPGDRIPLILDEKRIAWIAVADLLP
jgi:Uma2 family endonuclease